MPPFQELSNLPLMKELIREFNALDLHSQKGIELSEELSWVYEQAWSIKNLWREHFNYSLTDPRYLDADEATIYNDYLLFSSRNLSRSGLFTQRKKDTINYNIKTEEDLIKAIEKDCENIRNNKNNYVTPEFLQEYEDEKTRLLNEYYNEKKVMGKSDQEISKNMDLQRLVEISRLKNIPKLEKPK